MISAGKGAKRGFIEDINSEGHSSMKREMSKLQRINVMNLNEMNVQK